MSDDDGENIPLLFAERDTEKAHVVPVPPRHEAGTRTLVLLLDGTGDTDDDDISNVIGLRNMLFPLKDKEKQLVYYRRGIGTYHPRYPGLKDVNIPVVTSGSRTIDSAIAWSLKYHIHKAYSWLMKRYQEGDKICIFGFSRGAYTARAVAAMIHKVGLLPAGRKDKVWDAYYSFEKQGKDGWADSAAFKKENECRSVIIEFVGVWDTVSSVGLLRGKTYPSTASNGSVRVFRQAIALDEHRAKFKSNKWSVPSTDPAKQTKPLVTDVDQVWFAGCHCDVGGGSVPNDVRPNLADIALRWMVRECFKSDTGIMFDPSEIKKIGIEPASLYPIVITRPAALPVSPDMRVSTKLILKPSAISRAASWVSNLFNGGSKDTKPDYSAYASYSEERMDLLDALAPIYDQLVIKRFKWWPLEILPMRLWKPAKGKMELGVNLGAGRMIMPPVDAALTDRAAAATAGRVPLDPRWAKIRVHRSVKARMECPADGREQRYVPIATMNGLTLDKVDSRLIDWVD